jgi:two-component system sensor histidine kinase and response regulator WspE
MQRLKRMQNNGLRALETSTAPQDSTLSLEAQEALEDARRLLAKPSNCWWKNAELDEFGWQASQRAQCTTPRWPAACVRLPMC